MWNPGWQGGWNACGNKFLLYSRGTQVGTEQFFIRTQMPCSFFWSKYSLSCHLFQLLTCWLEIPNPIHWSVHLQPPNESPKKQEINIFLESSSLERWWSKWLPPPRVLWGMGSSELGAIWQSRLFRGRTHFFLKEGQERESVWLLSRPQNTLTEPAVQEVPAKRKGRLLTIGKKYDQQEGRKVQERESVWLLSRPKNGSLLNGIVVRAQDYIWGQQRIKKNWERKLRKQQFLAAQIKIYQ